ncbi:MAG: sigma-54 dependent transcriptional regulator [Chitinophagaceae bacterium]
MEKILIVEDRFIEANNLQMILERAGYTVCGIAASVQAALQLLEKETPDFVLLDIFLQGPATGIDLARVLRKKNIAFIYLSANSDRSTLEAAKTTHPYGFLVKPFREKDVLVTLEIARYLYQHSLDSLVRKEEAAPQPSNTHQQKATDTLPAFHGIIGKSTALQTALHHIEIVAPSDTSVLILGENGTGKERVADVIHQLSKRNGKPFIKVNCAALPPALIESALFGHERGAFTGALTRSIGRFEQAHNGTIFLDEIGELPPDLQVKLLRVLQEKEINRLGSSDTIKTDVRIIAATNRNLEQEVAEGRFRIDLYYRLNVFPVHLPPLRERQEDIPVLASHFMQQFSRSMGKSVTDFSHESQYAMMQHSWPGNIRELENFIERSVLLSKDNTITLLPQIQITTNTISKPEERAAIKTIEENEREHILATLKSCKGKISGKGGAAELLGVNVSTLNSKIKKLGIEKNRWSF